MSLVPAPLVDRRTASGLVRRLRAMVPHYTREWPAKDEDDPGVALLKLFAFLADGVIQRLNAAPRRHFLCFLDMLGIRLLPETPARVPVRLLPATGATAAILVNPGTRLSAAATAQHPELPFETTRSLKVVPASLQALLVADPSTDVILKPPPGFLTLETAAGADPVYAVAAFSSAGSDALQLDLVDGLQPGDFLRIEAEGTAGASGCVCGCASASGADGAGADFYIIKDLKARIVFLTEPLKRDYAESTPVRKLRRFDLQHGTDFQQHILYLAHAELFNVKSEARFEVTVRLAAGGPANLDPLDLAWEFYGATETKPQEGWHPLTIKSDSSAGLSADGEIQLAKPAGEIKETPVSQYQNRWIRARLLSKLPAQPERALPRIESVGLRVASTGDGLAADLAFHNDTPLALNLPFHPFGVEPRLFDRFYLASKEAFSKAGATVVVNPDLDYADLMASPSAVLDAPQGLLRVFAHGAAGRLVEFRIRPAGTEVDPAFVNHGKPGDTRILAGSIPAPVLSADGTRLGVFVRGDDGHVYLRLLVQLEAAASLWVDLGQPAVSGAQFNPIAIVADTRWRVFAVAGGQLYWREVDPANPTPPAAWNALPLGPTIGATPFVLDHHSVFITDALGRMHRYNGSTWTALDLQAAAGSRPFALRPSSESALAVLGRHPRGGVFYVHGDHAPVTFPDPESPLDSDLWAVWPRDGELRVYARSQDGRLWYLEPDAKPEPEWVPTPVPSEARLTGHPFVILGDVPVANTLSERFRFRSVLSATNRNSVVELREDVRIPADLLQGGPADLLILSGTSVTATLPAYVRLVAGPGAGELRVITRTVESLDRRTVALLNRPLPVVSTDQTEYQFMSEIATGTLVMVAEDRVTVRPRDPAISPGDLLIVGQHVREIGGYTEDPNDPDTAELELRGTWNLAPPQPTPGASFVVLHAGTAATAGEGADRLLVLASTASQTNQAYQGLALTIRSRAATGGARLIAQYSGRGQLAELERPFSSPPSGGESYLLSPATFSAGWRQHDDPDQTELRPELSWEYWNGSGWVTLHLSRDTTGRLLMPGEITFTVPPDIAPTEVAGQANFWIRARIVGGDYGRELFEIEKDTNKVLSRKDAIRPPLIKTLGLRYAFCEAIQPQVCLTLNNLSYLDQTAANRTSDKHYAPFEPLQDQHRALYFGFDQPFAGGPVRLYAVARELSLGEEDRPRFAWTFTAGNDQWKPLPTEDDTRAFTRPELITWTIPEPLAKRECFGEALHWVRATLGTGSWSAAPELAGLFLNTTTAEQVRTVANEILGSSDGTAHQTLQVAQPPVLAGEEIRVREALTDEERSQVLAAEGPDALLEVRDATGQVLETWVRWQEVTEFFVSGSASRHYRLDRASGEIEFGDGVHGRIPPAGGGNIRAFAYQTGGGAAGNVLAGEITALVSAVAGVDAVINPVPAGGGSARATADQMLELGPAQLSHRARAVTPQDFEWLAREASREVRKVRCVPNRNPQGRFQPGWVSVFVVPDSTDPAPLPSLELRRGVARYLAQRADLNLVQQDQLWVGPPEYVAVGVEVTVFARSLDDAGAAEQQVRARLDAFLHPLTGGADGTGWDFGRDLAVSDIHQQLEAIPEVDHVGPVLLHFNDQTSPTRAEIGPNALLTAGTHQLTLQVAEGVS